MESTGAIEIFCLSIEKLGSINSKNTWRWGYQPSHQILKSILYRDELVPEKLEFVRDY